MTDQCEYCGEATPPGPVGGRICARCRERDREDDWRWAEVAEAGGTWNTSQDDPWWRDLLMSRGLFDVYHEIIPRLGAPIADVLDGTVFAYERCSCEVEVWVSPIGVVVAYPALGRYTTPDQRRETLPEFSGWIDDLRHSEPLPLGQVRGRSSYGAIGPASPSAPPAVRWAQAGDWAALARRLRHDRPAFDAKA